ncbi:MAG: hypothetical protein LW724_17865 [Planctomycetaceae bacterium]|nr:hypothetical protein [Planctomycetaceae bacterium]
MMRLPIDSVTSKRSSVSLAWVFVVIGAALTIRIEDRAQATEVHASGGRIAMMSPQFHPIITKDDFVFVANTPNHTVDVIDKKVKSPITFRTRYRLSILNRRARRFFRSSIRFKTSIQRHKPHDSTSRLESFSPATRRLMFLYRARTKSR